jgi:hypothetical protein
MGQYNHLPNQPMMPPMPMINQPVAIPQQQYLNHYLRSLDYSKPLNIRCPCCSVHVTTTVNN